jgi:hemin uptake protein HemP
LFGASINSKITFKNHNSLNIDNDGQQYHQYHQ